MGQRSCLIWEGLNIFPPCGGCISKNNSALDDMSMVERREFFEPEPEDYRLDDEERRSRLVFDPI